MSSSYFRAFDVSANPVVIEDPADVEQVEAIAADLRLDFGSMCTVMKMMDLLMYQSINRDTDVRTDIRQQFEHVFFY